MPERAFADNIAREFEEDRTLAWVAAAAPAPNIDVKGDGAYKDLVADSTCDHDARLADRLVDTVFEELNRKSLERTRAFIGALFQATGRTAVLVPLLALYSAFADDKDATRRWLVTAMRTGSGTDPITLATLRLLQHTDDTDWANGQLTDLMTEWIEQRFDDGLWVTRGEPDAEGGVRGYGFRAEDPIGDCIGMVGLDDRGRWVDAGVALGAGPGDDAHHILFKDKEYDDELDRVVDSIKSPDDINALWRWAADHADLLDGVAKPLLVEDSMTIEQFVKAGFPKVSKDMDEVAMVVRFPEDEKYEHTHVILVKYVKEPGGVVSGEPPERLTVHPIDRV